jgi:hypothetical protein
MATNPPNCGAQRPPKEDRRSDGLITIFVWENNRAAPAQYVAILKSLDS